MSSQSEHNHVKFLDEHMENYNLETSAIHRKLQSKIEALKIMRKELERFRTERDQFKLMAETLQVRYSAIKKSLNSSGDFSYDTTNRSSAALILNETKEKNIALSTEVEALKEKLNEIQGDMKLLRVKNNEFCIQQTKSSQNMEVSNITFSNSEKSSFIAQLEMLKKKNAQLQYDFRASLDEKEEVVTERDAYKCKVHRLNHELNIALQGEQAQTKVIDIDALVLENKFLQEKLSNLENELKLASQSANKYKTMLDTKRKKGIIKLGTNTSDMIMSHKQVKTLLERGSLSDMPSNTATISDLKSLCLTLLDNLSDKNLAFTHQKKANKLLATRIAELEQRLQTICGSDSKKSLLSPSEILLYGYSASTVDQESSSQQQRDDDSGTASSECSKKTDALSEYEETCVESESSSEYSMGSLKINTVKDEMLEELPPEIAAMVEKTLRELDDTEDHNNADN